MNADFHSFLAKDIQAYLRYKRALGRKFDTEEKALYLFDRFITKHPVADVAALEPVLIEAFFASRHRIRARSYNHLLGVIRGFFNWLVTQQRLEHSPVQSRPRRTTSQPRPFVFEPEQVQQLLVLAAQLPDNPRAQHRGEVYPLIFTLMYGLGLRVGEISRLLYRDVDPARALLVIRESKFRKTRLVPYGPRMAERIRLYLQQRVSWYGEWQPEDPLFSFSDRHRTQVCPETISQTFRHLLPKLNLSIPPGVDAPRLHCLRHSFAVETLLRWYRTDADPARRLFQLSTFMGHADPASTAWYLTVTDALLEQANRRFERLACAVSRESVS